MTIRQWMYSSKLPSFRHDMELSSQLHALAAVYEAVWPWNWSGRCEEEKDLLPLPAIEPLTPRPSTS
jgi:hypothetical protein